MKSKIGLIALLLSFAGCAWTLDGTYPRALMRKNPDPIWSEKYSGETCNKPVVMHARGRKIISFSPRVFFRGKDDKSLPVSEARFWLRESKWNWVERLDYFGGEVSGILWDPSGEVVENYPGSAQSGAGFFFELRFETSSYYNCSDGKIREAIATYPYFVLLQVPGCKDKLLKVTGEDDQSPTVEMDCKKQDE